MLKIQAQKKKIKKKKECEHFYEMQAVSQALKHLLCLAGRKSDTVCFGGVQIYQKQSVLVSSKLTIDLLLYMGGTSRRLRSDDYQMSR